MEDFTAATPLHSSSRVLDTDAVVPTIADILSTVNTTSEMETTCLSQSQSNPPQVCFLLPDNIVFFSVPCVYLSLPFVLSFSLFLCNDISLYLNKKKFTTACRRRRRRKQNGFFDKLKTQINTHLSARIALPEQVYVMIRE